MANKDPVRVGVLYSETGVTSTIGKSQLQGTLLAIDEINEAGASTAGNWCRSSTMRSRPRRCMPGWPSA